MFNQKIIIPHFEYKDVMKSRYLIILLLFLGTEPLYARPGRIKLVDTVITLGGKEAYISYPAGFEGKYPVIMAIHGSGRGALSYDPRSEMSSPFYVHQRDLAVDNGFMFVVISNGTDTWGTDRGLTRLESLYRYIHKKYRVEKRWRLWATSAGGVLLARFVKNNPDKVCQVLGTFPVYDLKYEYFHLRSAYEAWGTDTAGIDRINPINYPQVFTDVPYLIFHGRSDSAVSLKRNSLRLQEDVNSRGGHVILHVVPGGHSTNNWRVYDDKIILDFLLNRYPCRRSRLPCHQGAPLGSAVGGQQISVLENE